MDHRHFKLTSLALAVALLGGCASGGGSFAVDDVADTKVVSNPIADNDPTFIKAPVKTEETPLMGYVMTGNIPVTVNGKFDDLSFEEKKKAKETLFPVALTEENQKRFGSRPDPVSEVTLYDPLTKTAFEEAALGDAETFSQPVYRGDYHKATLLNKGENGLGSHTASGLTYTLDDNYNPQAYQLFYYGDGLAKSLPMAGTVKYSGGTRLAYQLSGTDTSRQGVLTANEGASVDMTVDFSAKTFTVAMASKSPDSLKWNASGSGKINGAGFSGTMKGKDRIWRSTTPPADDYDTSYVIDGAFFGAKGEEVAGKYVSVDEQGRNNGLVVGVFNAAAGKTTGDTALEELHYVGLITHSAESFTDYEIADASKTAYLPQADLIEIDGKTLTINRTPDALGIDFPALAFVSAGALENRYFVKGTVTASADMPTAGAAQYAGKWTGSGTTDKDAAAYRNAEARFSADWTKKTLEGRLYGPDQVVSAETTPGITFSATIKGAGFSGEAVFNKLPTTVTRDADASAIGVFTGKGKVDGRFFGPGANELGGTILKEDKTFGAVFAGKQIETSEPRH